MIRGLFIFSMCLLVPMAFADTIYKTVDEDGNISYSAEPPPEGKEFKVLDSPKEPDEAGAREAEERQQKLEEYLDETTRSGTQSPQVPDAASTETGSTAVMADWRERKNEERRRSFWGENWPVHHPRHR